MDLLEFKSDWNSIFSFSSNEPLVHKNYLTNQVHKIDVLIRFYSRNNNSIACINIWSFSETRGF